MSVVPEAVTSTDAAFCHAAEPPLTDGGAGAVVSMRTVAVTQLLN